MLNIFNIFALVFIQRKRPHKDSSGKIQRLRGEGRNRRYLFYYHPVALNDAIGIKKC